MRIQTWRRVVRVSLLAVVGACGPSGSAPLSQVDSDAIRAASRGYAQAATDTAWTRWVGYFTEDASFLPPNTPIKTGRPAIEAWARSFPPVKELRLEPVEVVGRGDLAFVRGKYSLTLVGLAADSGKYIEIWQRQADGSWKLARDIFNSDIPLPAPAPTNARKKG